MFKHRRVLSAIATAIAASQGFADTVTVCPDGSCDFTTIRAAVKSASQGDVIEIGEGVYALVAPIELAGRNLVLQGPEATGDRSAVVIDGLDSTSAFVCTDGDRSIFRNLSFANGRGTLVTFPGQGTFSVGGAVQSFDASPTFEHCDFSSNVADFGGAALLFGAGTATFTDCTFQLNETLSDDGGAVLGFSQPGGALSLEFTGCDFAGNRTTTGQYGGAIASGDANLRLTDCRFNGNIAGGSAGGLGGAVSVEAYEGTPVVRIESCTFVENEVSAGDCFDEGLGGALFLDGCDDAVLIDCVFNDNRGGCSGGGGSAIWVQEGSPSFVECRFQHHDLGSNVIQTYLADVTLIDCDVAGNAVGEAIRFDAGMASMTNCTLTDNDNAVLLIDGNLDLEQCTIRDNLGEAVRGAGGNLVDVVDSLICGNNLGGPQFTGANVQVDDLSTISVDCPTDPPGDLDGDGSVNGVDLGLVFAGWGACGPDACPADLNGDGVVDGTDLGLLFIDWTG